MDISNMPNLATIDAFYKFRTHLFEHKEVLISLSGGWDSDIVLDLLHRVLTDEEKWEYSCNIHYVFFDTGIEYYATKRHLDELEKKYNIEIKRIKAKCPVPLGCKKFGLPFLSKYVSEMIKRLQKHNFDFAKDGNKSYEELKNKYNGLDVALKWWCNKNGDGSSFNINKNLFLKEFMIENPPDFMISPDCCKGAKKDNGKDYIKNNNIDLQVMGIRREENGIRSTNYSSCFSDNGGECNQYRPIFWFTDKDKVDYTIFFGCFPSDCYLTYKLKRTGCAGCPFGSRFEEELEIIQKYEPKLYKAVINIFGKSYDYTRKYREYKERKKKIVENQITIFDIIGDKE